MLNETPLSAGLGKRLSEAADGFHDGLYHYFIASRTSPYYLFAPAGDADDLTARGYAYIELENRQNEFPGRDYEVFGPYFTPDDEAVRLFDYIEIRLMKNSLYKQTEVYKTIVLDADADAVFFNMSSVDKFVTPYYTRLYGCEMAETMRQTAKLNFQTAKASIHKGGTNFD